MKMLRFPLPMQERLLEQTVKGRRAMMGDSRWEERVFLEGETGWDGEVCVGPMLYMRELPGPAEAPATVPEGAEYHWPTPPVTPYEMSYQIDGQSVCWRFGKWDEFVAFMKAKCKGSPGTQSDKFWEDIDKEVAAKRANVTDLQRVKAAVMEELNCQLGSLSIVGSGKPAILGHMVQILQDGKPVGGLRRLTLVIDLEDAVRAYMEYCPGGEVCAVEHGKSMLERTYAPPTKPMIPRGTVDGGWGVCYDEILPDGSVLLPDRPVSLMEALEAIRQNRVAAEIVCPHGQVAARVVFQDGMDGMEAQMWRHGIEEHSDLFVGAAKRFTMERALFLTGKKVLEALEDDKPVIVDTSTSHCIEVKLAQYMDEKTVLTVWKAYHANPVETQEHPPETIQATVARILSLAELYAVPAATLTCILVRVHRNGLGMALVDYFQSMANGPRVELVP